MKFQELQKEVSRLVLGNSRPYDYQNLLNEVEARVYGKVSDVPDYFKSPRLAFLSNFTMNTLPEITQVRGIFHNLLPEIYAGSYNQAAQEILNDKSGLYEFNPDLIYLIIDTKSLPVSEVAGLVDQLLLRAKAKIVIFNPELTEKYKENKQVLIFNFGKWLDDSGHRGNWYTKYKDLGDLRLAPAAFPDLAEKLLSFAVAVSGGTKKCLVVDLDNTLWQGILGEDGIDNIKPNRELQKFLIGCLKKGTILAINSRNNEAEALTAIDSHPDMVLRKKDFADWQINWGDKAQNMIALAESLNLGLDSFVFLDDDDFQLGLVREVLPQVAVVPVKDEKSALKFLNDFAGFAKLEITKEDLKRGQMYAEERQRKTLQSSLKTLDEFLKELNLKTLIKPVNEETLTRASQLTQKTNQFNLTTRRYSEEQLKDCLARGWKIWTISATDKFGDYGIIGLAMVEPLENFWRVDNFLMSCRILGRGIEDTVVKFILSQAKKAGVKTIFASYIATSKNGQAKDFWDRQDFLPNDQSKDFWDRQGFKLAAQFHGGVSDGLKKYYRDVA